PPYMLQGLGLVAVEGKKPLLLEERTDGGVKLHLPIGRLPRGEALNVHHLPLVKREGRQAPEKRGGIHP
ncbi:MAG TPA: hypothetical protein VI877_05320, partial [Dehalococcoidia bacterium]|nr:hypothetical protein [Dehalococcoidia bacterium]